ncbi:MAG: vWA domain-containing protein [Janthinobacterium lividum]
MSFEEPRYLHLAWLLPLLAAGYWLSHYQLARAQAALLPTGWGGPRGPARLRFCLKLALRLLALAALVLALAGPRRAQPSHPNLPQGAAKLVFVVDVSRSMLAADLLPDRLSQAQKVVAEVVKGLHGQEAALVVFAGQAQLYMPLTTDYEALIRSCPTIAPALVPRQGTSLAAALDLAARVFGAAASPQARVICVLSDGENHPAGYEALADSLGKAGISLYAVGIGTLAGGTMLVPGLNGGPAVLKRDGQGRPIVSHLQEAQLQRLVQHRPNHYIRLDTWQNVAAHLRAEIEKLEPAGASPSGNKSRPTDYFQLYLLAAFGLLLVEFLVPPGRQLSPDGSPK